MNEFDEAAQHRACEKLLSAVLGLAIEDAQMAPIKISSSRLEQTPRDEAITAIRFLFTDDCDGYLAALDIDPEQFRKRLFNMMYSKYGEETLKNQRAMKFNYEYFYKNYGIFDWNSLHKDYGGL